MFAFFDKYVEKIMWFHSSIIHTPKQEKIKIFISIRTELVTVLIQIGDLFTEHVKVVFTSTFPKGYSTTYSWFSRLTR